MEPANFRSQGAAAPWRKNIARIQRLSKVVNQKEGHVLRRQAKRGAEGKKGKEPIVERGEKGSFSNDEFLFPHPYFSSTSFSSVFLLSWHSASRRTLTRYEHSNWPVKSLNWHSSFPFTHRLWRQPAIFLNSSRIVMKSSAFVHMTVWRREEEAAKEEGYTGGEHSDDF